MAKKSKQNAAETASSHGNAHKKLKAGKVKKASEDEKVVSKLLRKQMELARVLTLKCSLLTQGNLSYLEYKELSDEIARLSALKELFASQSI